MSLKDKALKRGRQLARFNALWVTACSMPRVEEAKRYFGNYYVRHAVSTTGTGKTFKYI